MSDVSPLIDPNPRPPAIRFVLSVLKIGFIVVFMIIGDTSFICMFQHLLVRMERDILSPFKTA
jgi:hypothetical protein